MIYGYVSLHELSVYLQEFPEFDDLVCHFKVLPDNAKIHYLLDAADEINSLVMQGSPVDREQRMAFPRKGCFKPYTVPQEVKEAQMENAISLFKDDLSKRSEEQMKTMLSLGLMKNLKYSKRESGNLGLSDSLDISMSTKTKRLSSSAAERLLRPWTGGGYA